MVERYAQEFPPGHMAPEDRVQLGTPPLEERRKKTKGCGGIEGLRRGREMGSFILLSCVASTPTYCLWSGDLVLSHERHHDHDVGVSHSSQH